MPPNNDQPVSQWIQNLRDGDEEAALRLWSAYFEELVGAAKRRLADVPKKAWDEEDVAVSVFTSLCKGAAEGRFPNLSNRDDLWHLLLAVTRQKAVNRIRNELALKRGGGALQDESSIGRAREGTGLDDCPSDSVPPEVIVEFDDQLSHLLKLLRNDTVRSVATLKMEGHTSKQIAAELGISVRSVARKLDLIRDTWANEID